MRANGIEVSKDNPLIIEEDLSIDGSQITSGKADAAFLIQPADTDRIQSLLHNPGLRLMNFALEADAYANRFPALVKVMLNRGAVEFEPVTPAGDITLLATSVALVARADIEPSLMSLLTFAVSTIRAQPSIRRATRCCSTAPVRSRISAIRSTGSPRRRDSSTRRVSCRSPCARLHPPCTKAGFPYSVTGFVADYGAQTVLLLIPSLVILLPMLRVVPSVYNWSVRRRLLYWYRQLKALEKNLDHPAQRGELATYQAEIERIDAGVRRIRYPLNFSDQFYHLRLHIELVRQRLFQKPHAVRIAAE